MAKDPTLKKKRKSDAAGLEAPIEPEAVPAVEGTVSAEAVVAEVDAEKAAKKAKKEKRKSLAATETEDVVMESGDKEKKSDFPVPLASISPIASPLAPKKLQKKLFKLTKRSSKQRQLKRGVKEVVKALRKGEKGLLVLASNITPVDVISHLPVLAEEAVGVEYVWVLSKEELGVSSGTKRATSCVLICSQPHKRAAGKPAPSAEDEKEWKELLEECVDEVKKLDGGAPIAF